MKSLLIAFLLGCGVASATTVISETWEIGATVPDHSTLGWSDTRYIESTAGSILDVQVHLKISGGFNGDLYAYLAHESGFAILLNRPGRTAANPDGSFTTGIDAVFASAAGLDAHLADSFAGTFQPDGRNISPYLVTDESPRTALLTSFEGGDSWGYWTLFVADLSPMLESTVDEWGLVITAETLAIPEPGPISITLLLTGFALLKRRR
jgi:subtilisin-like proprotein convertase family protein